MNILKWQDKYSTDIQLVYQSESTRKNYTSCVKSFLYHFKDEKEPKAIPTDSIKKYLLTIVKTNTLKHNLCAVKSFYKITVGMPSKIDKIPYPKKVKSLPKVIEKKILADKINAIPNLKHKAILMLGYSIGLRVSEVINMKIEDIDSKRMMILIKNAKGAKDRYVPLSENVLATLRKYFVEYKPKVYLFNGQGSLQYSDRSCNEIMKKYIGPGTHFHMLRHSSFTAMLESGVDTRIIQKVAGHTNIKTTEIYTHVSNDLMKNVYTPM